MNVHGIPSAPLSAQVPLAELLDEIERKITEARAKVRQYMASPHVALGWECRKAALYDFREWLLARETPEARADNDEAHRPAGK